VVHIKGVIWYGLNSHLASNKLWLWVLWKACRITPLIHLKGVNLSSIYTGQPPRQTITLYNSLPGDVHAYRADFELAIVLYGLHTKGPVNAYGKKAVILHDISATEHHTNLLALFQRNLYNITTLHRSKVVVIYHSLKR